MIPALPPDGQTECLAAHARAWCADSSGDALLAMGPILLGQMRRQVAEAEPDGTDEARLRAHEALKQMVAWAC